MLDPRYEFDGNPSLSLSELQLNVRNQVVRKIEQKVYKVEDTSCPVCNGGRWELLSEKDRYGLYFPVVVCRDCGLIQTSSRMDEDSYRAFYDKEYRQLYVGERHPSETFFRRQYKKGSRIYKYLQDYGFFSDRKDMFVFEVGCGAGGILQYFKEKGCKVQGVDLGAEYIEYGKNKYGLDLMHGSLKEQTLSNSPDIVIYNHVFEHILYPNSELNTVRDVLADNGSLYLEVPGIKNLMKRSTVDFLRLIQNAHVFYFTLKTLNNLMMKNGFEPVKGDEKVRCIYKKNPKVKKHSKFSSDYNDVLYYLNKSEKLIKYHLERPSILRKMPMPVINGISSFVDALKCFRKS